MCGEVDLRFLALLIDVGDLTQGFVGHGLGIAFYQRKGGDEGESVRPGTAARVHLRPEVGADGDEGVEDGPVPPDPGEEKREEDKTAQDGSGQVHGFGNPP